MKAVHRLSALSAALWALGVPASGLFTAHAAPNTQLPASRAAGGEDLYLFATEVFGRKMYELAIQQYEKFVKTHPDHPREFQARLRTGEAYLRLERYEPAVESYEAALAADPRSAFRAEALVGLGLALFNARQYPRATDVLAEAQPLVANDRVLGPLAANWFGEALFAQGRFADAARAFEKVLTWPGNPHEPQALYSLGFSFLKQGETGKAVSTFRRLGAEHPKSPRAAEGLVRAGDLLLREKKYRDAEGAFRDAAQRVATPGTAADASWGLAWAAYAQQQYPEARGGFEQFAATYPKSTRAPEAQLRLGDCLYREQQYPEAAAAYEKAAAALKGERAREARYWLGMSRWKAGDPVRAASEFRALLAEGAGDSATQRARQRLGELEAGPASRRS